MRAETCIREINKRGYTIKATQSDNLSWHIELRNITARGAVTVKELLDYSDLADGLMQLLKWLDEPMEMGTMTMKIVKIEKEVR